MFRNDVTCQPIFLSYNLQYAFIRTFLFLMPFEMNLKKGASSVLKLGIAGTSVIFTFYTVIRLMVFLSDPNFTTNEDEPQGDFWVWISWKLLVNTALLSLFMLQHSLLALPNVKALFDKWNLQDVQRSTYVIVTCLVLQVLLSNWLAIPELSVWHWNTRNKIAYWVFFFIQAFGWLVVYVGNICMDLNELLGTKQVYYSIRNLPDPNTYKSYELRKLYSHMRHPSVTGFLIIFWIVPVMTFDRFILATLLSAYMFIAWKTDTTDYHYQEMQYRKKFYGVHY